MYQHQKVYIQVGITKRQVVKIAAVGTVTVMFTVSAAKAVDRSITPYLRRLSQKLVEKAQQEEAKNEK